MVHMAAGPQVADLSRGEVLATQDQVDVIPMVAVFTFDHVDVIKRALPVSSHRVEKVSPYTANAFEVRRKELILEGQAVDLTAVAK